MTLNLPSTSNTHPDSGLPSQVSKTLLIDSALPNQSPQIHNTLLIDEAIPTHELSQVNKTLLIGSAVATPNRPKVCTTILIDSAVPTTPPQTGTTLLQDPLAPLPPAVLPRLAP